MSRPAVPASVLAVIIGCAAMLFCAPFLRAGFDGRARSLVVPQVLWLGWALLMVVSARMPARQTAWTFLGAAATFYGLWATSLLVTAFLLPQPHG